MHVPLKKCLAILLLTATGHALASDVNVGVSVSGEVAPGVYGRIDIGNTPPPVIYTQPVIITRTTVAPPPVYMHVPPGHAKKWSKHCHKYNACAQPVYFVKSSEYGYDGGGKHNGKHRGKGNDEKHGHGKGNGKGHGKD